MPKNSRTVVVYGRQGVGRSALTIRFMQNLFVVKYDPQIEDLFEKNITVDEKKYHLEILDCACGMPDIRRAMMKKSCGIILVYDITDPVSFEEIEGLYQECVRECQPQKKNYMLCGNKCDLEEERKVDTSAGQSLAESHGWLFIETSAKTGENVEKLFFDVIRSQANDNSQNCKDEKSRGCVIC